jgi:hypothetical protein
LGPLTPAKTITSSPLLPNNIEQSKDFVRASAVAVSQCPEIVKRRIEELTREIGELKSKVKEQEVRLKLRKNDFDKVYGLELKKEATAFRQRQEALYRQRIEEEKRRAQKGRSEEFQELIAENRALMEEIARLTAAQ